MKTMCRNRAEKCGHCGRGKLVSSPCARTLRCDSCGAGGTVNRVRPPQESPVRHAASWLKGKITSSLPAGLTAHADRWLRGGGGYSVSRPLSYPAVHGNKRALLCGVNYYGRRYELKGSVNDVKHMSYLLTERFNFPEDCILTLTEDEKYPNRIPTKENMQAAMRWLVQGCRLGDSLVFHFSGHGAQKLNMNHDENDGYDETLCPMDYETNGMILDDEINHTIVHPIPTGAKLHAIIDACHSGTVLDLPYFCRMNRGGFFQWEDHRPKSGSFKGTNGGMAICFSGCDDHQTSADTSALARSVTTGAMTYSFILTLETETGPTYGRILNVMRSVIHGADTGIHIPGPIASMIRKVFNCGLTQEPQLSSSEKFDIYRRPFLL